MYRIWQVEYESAITPEDCEEVKRFYKPYLKKYESKYMILYQMLQQGNKQTSYTSAPSVQKHTSKITHGLAVLDDAQALIKKEWRRGEPSRDVPRQYSTLCRHLTVMQPRHEDMRMDPTLNITPEGSLGDLPAVTGGNTDLR